jgi:AraC-like DNA-binding protein
MCHQDWVGMYRNSHLDIEMLRGYFVERAFSPHMHDYYVIGLIDQGVQSFSYRGTKYITPQGGLLFLNPGEAHTGEAVDGVGFKYYALYPTLSHVKKIVSDLTGRDNELPFFKNVRVDDPELAKQLRELHISLIDDNSSLQSECMLICLLTNLVKKYANIRFSEKSVGKEHRAIEKAQEYIHANWSKGVSLSQLAEITGLSRYYFLRLFSQVMGMPPHAYLESVRIIHAKQLIKVGQPLNDVAYATGFSDQSHFTNRFKQYLGVTPGQYVRGLQ